jgi:chemotaxis protein MotB
MRSRRIGPEPEAEGYLVSVSDLMVGLLFVFILILLAFALQLREAERAAERERLELVSQRELVEEERNALTADRNDLRIQLADLSRRFLELEQERRRQEEELRQAREMQRADLAAVRSNVRTELNDEIQRIEEALRLAHSMREQLLRTIERALKARGVPVTVDVASGVLRLADRILFASGSSDLPTTGPARDALRAVADVFGETLPCFTASGAGHSSCPADSAAIIDAVFIEGHTDKRRLGTGERDGNYDLSAARALTTYGAIQTARPALWTLRNRGSLPLMGVSGYGPDRPILGRESDREEDLAANRRIEIRFILAVPTPPEFGALRARLEDLLQDRTP